MKRKRIVVVGAGLAGLTAAAYAARAGHEVLVLEKGPRPGGLVQSFERGGFVFDTGPRAFVDAGILRPMLAELGIGLPMVRGFVSTGIEDEIVHYDDGRGVEDFLASLRRLFPARTREIAALGRKIAAACRSARDLHRLPNPYFKPPFADIPYLLGSFLPWLPSFLRVALESAVDRRPVERVLASMSSDASFNDGVSQHFFRGTPWLFALGYYESFQEYWYPLGGTGMLPLALAADLRAHGGGLRCGHEAVELRVADRIVRDGDGREHGYDELLWAADLNTLYARLDETALDANRRRRIERERARFLAARPGESVFSAFLAVDAPPDYFAGVSRGHLVYTPRKEGLDSIHRERLANLKSRFDAVSKEELFAWLAEFFRYTSYEISIPALKDPSLAPPGKSALSVSTLFDGELHALVRRAGFAEEFDARAVAAMIDALDGSVYPGLRGRILFSMSASPGTLESMFGASGGAITGWSLEGRPPVASSLVSVLSSVRTGIPHVRKAGQWSYSPSGVPVAILTGRIAAQAMTRGRP